MLRGDKGIEAERVVLLSRVVWHDVLPYTLRMQRLGPARGLVDYNRYDGDGGRPLPFPDFAPLVSVPPATWEPDHGGYRDGGAWPADDPDPGDAPRDLDIDSPADYEAQQRRARDLASLGEALFPLACLCADAAVAASLGDPARALVACARRGCPSVAAAVARRWRLPRAAAWADGEGDAYDALRVALGRGDSRFVAWLRSALGDPPPLAIPQVEAVYARSVLHAAVSSGVVALAQYVLSLRSPAILAPATKDGDAGVGIQALHTACGSKSSDMVALICSKFDLKLCDVRNYSNFALKRSCASGSVDVIKWLCSHYPLSVADVRTDNCEALRLCCDGGHVEAADWICTNFGLTKEDLMEKNFEFSISHGDATVQDNQPFHDACESGNLSYVQLFAKQFSISREDVQSKSNYSLWTACVSGFVDIASWLVQEYSLTATDLRATTFTLTCGMGHLECARWINNTFGSPSLSALQSALETSTKQRRSRVVEWILETFPILGLSPDVLRPLCEAGLLRTLSQLTTKYSIGPDSPLVRDWIQSSFLICCSKGLFNTVKWLLDDFGIPIPMVMAQCFNECHNNRHIRLVKWLYGRCKEAPLYSDAAYCRQSCLQGQFDNFQLLLSSISTQLTRLQTLDLLSAALSQGHIGIASWLIHHEHIQTLEGRLQAKSVIENCCYAGRIRTAKWFCHQFRVQASPPSIDWNHISVPELRETGKHMAMWIKLNFGVVPPIVEEQLKNGQRLDSTEPPYTVPVLPPASETEADVAECDRRVRLLAPPKCSIM
ncbi:hypothetical protein Pelo_12947 [Pelomyxa schiedti]|nr:hypothetical protein Pelo_12947 [Pelomyxa schiedti]